MSAGLTSQMTDVDENELRSRVEQLHGSLRSLLSLRDDIEVYPGHYAGSTCGRGMDGKASSTIGRERRFNPAVQLDFERFSEFQLSNAPPPTARLPRDQAHECWPRYQHDAIH